MEPLGIGSLQFLSRVAVHRSCQSCWETATSSAMDTRQAASVANAEIKSKLSNSMMRMMGEMIKESLKKVWGTIFGSGDDGFLVFLCVKSAAPPLRTPNAPGSYQRRAFALRMNELRRCNMNYVLKIITKWCFWCLQSANHRWLCG
ncbi:hypothetical protein ILYODFUR_026598 [Ilyodon furcidens]|uniref:Uncharacterized protein n=1 Tax=Ilyodon furcidens TaxID=33524 RepID=A0ABV0UVE4_9TELE